MIVATKGFYAAMLIKTNILNLLYVFLNQQRIFLVNIEY